MRADNSSHLAAAAKQRHEQTRAKAIAALHDLDQTGAAISFQAVADRANVSRSWLYTQTDLKDEIRRIRALHQPTPGHRTRSPQPASDASLRQRLTLAHQRIRELDEDNHRLRSQIAHLHGQNRANRTTASKTLSTTQTP